MSKVKKETALVASGDVPSVMNLLEKKLKALKKITDQPYKTTGHLDCGGQKIDVKTEKNIGNLIKAFSAVNGREQMYQAAAKKLGVETYPVLEISGGTVNDWEQDIKIRLAVLQYEERKNKLQKASDKMAKFMSEEDQKKLVMAEVAALLKEEESEE